MTENIHTAINAVMQDVGYVKKERAANLNYSFAGESALIAAIRPSMVEHGVYMHVLEIKEIQREQYTTSKGTAMVNTVISGVVRFTHAPSATFVDAAATGEGADAGDKSANKAMTGLFKYALRQTFMIETGDDPDKSASEEGGPRSKPAKDDGPITADAWEKWLELVDQAKAAGIEVEEVKRAKTTLAELRQLYKGLSAEMA
jgi:hypothetical protein